MEGSTKVNVAMVLRAFDEVYNVNKVDSASYAMGIRYARHYKEQGVPAINKTLLARAITDAMDAKKPQFDEATANSVITSYMMNIYENKAQPRIDAGNAFLKQNKLRPGVKTTATGLQYEVISEGNGQRPTAADSVTVHYKGVLLNETVPFDDSYSRGQPITFALRGVIPGWTEGLQLMTTGSKYKFYIPYNLGYGAFGYGPIPGGALLVFEVELLDVKKVPGN
jgi:FKBP-type peptidyl-prolyl cis-trans isomerase